MPIRYDEKDNFFSVSCYSLPLEKKFIHLLINSNLCILKIVNDSPGMIEIGNMVLDEIGKK